MQVRFFRRAHEEQPYKDEVNETQAVTRRNGATIERRIMVLLIMTVCTVIVVGYIGYPFFVNVPQTDPQESQELLTQIEKELEQEIVALRNASIEPVTKTLPG